MNVDQRAPRNIEQKAKLYGHLGSGSISSVQFVLQISVWRRSGVELSRGEVVLGKFDPLSLGDGSSKAPIARLMLHWTVNNE